MKTRKILSKVVGLILVATLAITLAACKKETAYYGKGVEPNSVFLTAGDYKVTNSQFYEGLKKSGNSVLTKLINDSVLAEYVAKVDLANKEHKQFLQELVNEKLYGVKTEKEIEKAKKDNPSLVSSIISKKLDNYLNGLVKDGSLANADTFKTRLTNLVNTASFDYPNEILSLYKLDLAKKIYAKEVYDKEVLDDTKSVFVKDEDVLKHYKENNRKHYDVTYFSFMASTIEVSSALRQLQYKANNDGKFFQLPDVNKIIADNKLNDADNARVKKIIDDNKIPQRALNEYELYKTFYDAYQIDKDKDLALTSEQVFELFVKIYNLLNPASQEITISNAQTFELTQNGKVLDLKRVYKDVKETDGELLTYIYDNLGTGTGRRQFTTTPQTKNSKEQMVFLIDPVKQDDKVKEIDKNVYDEKTDKFLDTAEATKVKDAIKKQLLEDNFNDSYVSTKYNELLEKTTIKINDGFLYVNYKIDKLTNKNIKEGSSKEQLVEISFAKELKLKEQKISYKQFYDLATVQLGLGVYSQLLKNEFSNKLYKDKVTSEEIKQADEQVKIDLINFGNNRSSNSQQYPASIGRAAYLETRYKAYSKQEAVDNIVQQLVNANFDKDYTQQYKDIYASLTKLTKAVFDNYWSVGISHLLIFVDNDGDGKNDNLTVDNTKLVDLIKHAYMSKDKVTSNKKLEDVLKEFSEEFNKQPRIVSHENYEYDKDTNTSSVKESKINLTYAQIAELRKAGLTTKFEDLSEKTNYDLIPSKSQFVEKFATLINTIYNEHKQSGLTSDYMLYKSDVITGLTSDVSQAYLDQIQTQFGWHLVLAKKGQELKSAKVEKVDDKLKTIKGKDGKSISYTNTEKVVNASQIQVYLEAKSNGEYSVDKFLPSQVIRAIESQTKLVLDRFNGQQSNLNKIFDQVGKLTFTKTELLQRHEQLMKINNFELNDGLVLADNPEYNSIWGQWSELIK